MKLSELYAAISAELITHGDRDLAIITPVNVVRQEAYLEVDGLPLAGKNYSSPERNTLRLEHFTWTIDRTDNEVRITLT